MKRNRRVKIVATLGPSSSDQETIKRLFEAGADVFRINMSHASHEGLTELLRIIRKVEADAGRPIGILVDLQGPKLRVGEFAAMLAVIAYAVTPVIRYTDHGIRQISPDLIEAAKQVGCTRNQVLRKVQIPLALPHIMPGVNQTIMFALSMLVITALVGTRELGQEVYIALTKADTGRGIVAGVCVAFIAIIADRLIGAWASSRRKREYGLA